MLRRAVLLLTLLLVAALGAGMILGLDDAARRTLVGDPLASPRPTATVATTSTVSPSPSADPTGTATPSARVTPTQTPTAAPKSKPTATATPRSRPHPTPSRTPTAKPSRTPTARPSTTPSAYLARPLSRGRGGTVYLTFDDGPGPYTAQVLAVLSRTRSTATFFHLGREARGYPQVAAQVGRQASNIGNHSYDHPDLTRLDATDLRREISNGPGARCFRPPYGAADRTVRAAIAAAGMREVRWDVDTFDWTRPGIQQLAQAGRLKSIRHGSIVLLHDGGGDRSQTVAALPTIIADLQARGFRVRALPYC